jgi:ribonuclease VapC
VIVDSSAIVAVVFQEQGYESLLGKLEVSPSTGMGAPTIVETGIVLAARMRSDPIDLMARLLDTFNIVEVPFGEPHWREAVRAYLRFGRGRHPAGLNFGDCLAYAIARVAEEPLLFTGRDFARTDIEAA